MLLFSAPGVIVPFNLLLPGGSQGTAGSDLAHGIADGFIVKGCAVGIGAVVNGPIRPDAKMTGSFHGVYGPWS